MHRGCRVATLADSAVDAAADDRGLRRTRLVGVLIVLVTFGGFGGWAALAPLQSAAVAPGIVTVKGSRKSVEHLEGGIVWELLIKDGDLVQAGQLLISLDDTQARAQLEMAMSQYYAVKAMESRLFAERDGLASIEFDAVLADGADPRAADAMLSQQQVFEARRNAHEGEIAVLEQRIEQLAQQVQGARGLMAGKQRLEASFREEYGDYAGLQAQGYTDKQRLRELERNLANTEGEVAELVSEVARLEISAGETRLEILQLQKAFHTSVVEQLGEVQIQVFDLEERIRATADRAERTRIRSPVDGVVVGMDVTTLGEVVKPGETLLYVVPNAEELIVEARVDPADIDRVSSGQPADIRFSSFSSATTPVIDGQVTSLSADALRDESSGLAYYLARVEVTPEGYDMLDELELVPGMPAEVLINTGSRSMLAYLTQPVRNAFARSMLEE